MSSPLFATLTAAASSSAPDTATGDGYSDPFFPGQEAGGVSRSHLNIEIENAAGADMNDLIVQLKDHPDGDWYSYLGAADYVSGSNSNMLFASGTPSPDQTADGTRTHMHIRVGAAYGVRFGPQLASGAGVVRFRLSAASN
jgi:hypothetical protein